MNGQFKTAAGHFTRALANEPENAKTLSNQAACYQKLEQLDLCVEVRIWEEQMVIVVFFAGLQEKHLSGSSLCETSTEESSCVEEPEKVEGEQERLQGCPWDGPRVQRS